MDALQIYLTHRSTLVDYATPIVGSRSRAEDVVQEAWFRFSAAVGGEPRGAGPVAQPVAYLYRIVRNLALDLVRHSRFETASAAAEVTLARIPAATPSPEEQALFRAEVRLVEQVLAELPARTRRAFQMHRIEGRTLQQTAIALGISVTRTHQLVAAALTACADRLDAVGPKHRD